MGIDGGSVLLSEFGTWLQHQRGLAPESVRCYCNQARAFLAGIGGRTLSAYWMRARSPRSWWVTPASATAGRRRRW